MCSFYQQWFVTNLDFVGPCLLVLKVVADNQMKYRRGSHTVQFSQVKFNHSYSKNSFSHFRLKVTSKGVETSLAVTHFHCKISFKETTFTVLKLNCLCSTRFFFFISHQSCRNKLHNVLLQSGEWNAVSTGKRLHFCAQTSRSCPL